MKTHPANSVKQRDSIIFQLRGETFTGFYSPKITLHDVPKSKGLFTHSVISHTSIYKLQLLFLWQLNLECRLCKTQFLPFKNFSRQVFELQVRPHWSGIRTFNAVKKCAGEPAAVVGTLSKSSCSLILLANSQKSNVFMQFCTQ